jgi:hypothetical protein
LGFKRVVCGGEAESKVDNESLIEQSNERGPTAVEGRNKGADGMSKGCRKELRIMDEEEEEEKEESVVDKSRKVGDCIGPGDPLLPRHRRGGCG